MGLVLTTVIVVLALVVIVLSDLVAVRKMDDDAEEKLEGPRDFWTCRLSSFHAFLVKMLPLTSIKIVVVVWQILTQVNVVLKVTKLVEVTYTDLGDRLQITSGSRSRNDGNGVTTKHMF